MMLMLMVEEATTWLPTLQFELLLVSACKFYNFKSYLDNARVSGDDDGELPDGGGGDEHGHDSGDEELPDGGHPPCSHSYGSLVAHHC